MTIGEIEYTRFFTDQELFSPTFSRVVFLAFCVMMPIVLMNLTVRTFSHFLFLYVMCNLQPEIRLRSRENVLLSQLLASWP